MIFFNRMNLLIQSYFLNFAIVKVFQRRSSTINASKGLVYRDARRELKKERRWEDRGESAKLSSSREFSTALRSLLLVRQGCRKLSRAPSRFLLPHTSYDSPSFLATTSFFRLSDSLSPSFSLSFSFSQITPSEFGSLFSRRWSPAIALVLVLILVAGTKALAATVGTWQGSIIMATAPCSRRIFTS